MEHRTGYQKNVKGVLNLIASLLLIALFLTSCTKFQYLTVNSQNSNNSHTLVVADNDTLKIEYRFNGLNGPVNLTIYNKQNQPLYVDWEKSALIINDKRFSYHNTNDEIHLYSNNAEIRWNETVSSSSGTASGSIKRDAATSFIPPNSYITQKRLALRSDFITYPKKQFREKNITSIDGRIIPVRVIEFTPENTPIKFRSYLTLTIDKQDIKYDNSFWVSEIMETLAEPKNLPIDANQFHVEKSTGFSQVMGITGLLTVLTVAVIVAE